MELTRIEREMYLYQLEQAFSLSDENETLFFNLLKAEMWMTEFNLHNHIQ